MKNCFKPKSANGSGEQDRVVVERVKLDAGFDHAASVLWGNFDVFGIEKLNYHNFPWINKGAIDYILIDFQQLDLLHQLKKRPKHNKDQDG